MCDDSWRHEQHIFECPTLFVHICVQERDGSAFLVRSINNQFVGISRLNDAYTDTTGLVSVAPRV